MTRQLSRTAISMLVVAFAFTMNAAAATPSGKKYASPDKAVDAFVSTVRSNNTQALIAIFGASSQRLFESDDPTLDQKIRTEFLKLYDSDHKLANRPDGSQILIVGASGWPFPIPLVKSGSQWAWDTEAGADEIINRRIGRNELGAIQTCLAVGDAEREYYLTDRDGDGILEYAQTFRSSVGLHNGLYWPADTDEPQSPLGLFVIKASEEGYPPASGAYHGYHYKLLSSQGPNAPGGAYDYMARDNQIGGFAVVAWPSNYGETGVMTFMFSHSGIVFQKDLGPDTETLAGKISTFDPGEGWTKVSDEDTEPMSDVEP